MLRERLLVRNQCLILLNSPFTVVNETEISQFEKNRLVSSANIIGPSIFKALGKSLT